jgi:hypothetical protein
MACQLTPERRLEAHLRLAWSRSLEEHGIHSFRRWLGRVLDERLLTQELQRHAPLRVTSSLAIEDRPDEDDRPEDRRS